MTLDVGDAEVDKTLEIMRKQRVTYNVTEDVTEEKAERAAQNGDPERPFMEY